MNLKKCIYPLLKPSMKLMSSVAKKKNKAVFISFSGKAYSDNPRAISEALHEISPETEIVWIFKEPEKMKDVVPDYVRCIDNRHRTLMKELSDAKIWINSFLFSPLLYKGKDQLYIHTWHGDRPFKKVLFDRVGKYSAYKEIFEQKSADYIVTGSEFGEKVIRSAFRYSGKLMDVGCPRNDKLFTCPENEILKIKESLGLKKETKVLLFAPTFRQHINLTDGKQNMNDVEFEEILSALEKKYGGDWVCLVRAHKSGNGLTGIEYNDRIIDVTEYQDMADLLLIADFLITDYSSSYSDFALKNAPAILYQTDRESYMNNEREFYYDIADTPFTVAQTKEELIKTIMEFDDSNIEEHCKKILDFYGCYEDGHATEKAVKIIKEFLDR